MTTHARWATRHPVLVLLLAIAVATASTWAVKLTLVGRSVSRAADFWATPQGDSGGLLYVALGDSVAQSVGASRPERGYVALIAQRLRKETGQPVEVVNLSRSGAVIADVLDRQIPALLALGRSPDLVTVAIGGNDVRAYDAADFAAEVRQMMLGLPAGTFVADAPYFMHGRWEANAEQAARALTDGARTQGLHAVPLHEALRAEGWKAMLTQFAADWFHPNDRGHRVWADAFWTAIEPTLAPDGSVVQP